MNSQPRSIAKSVEAFRQAEKSIVGGVNSPVRACKSVAANPLFIASGKGAFIEDIDGNRYLDYVCSWGPLILGHAYPSVIEAIQHTASLGTSFGAPTSIETQMAELLIERVPSIEMVRMVNSGTEATMSAIRLARGYTKRNKIVKFSGCYHGHVDAMLIKAGSGIVTLGLPDSPGVPSSVVEHTISLAYNDLEGVQQTFARCGEEIAAIIVEPVAGNMGVVEPAEGFLPGLRTISEQYGSVLIFDEVMTGFRVHRHSAQGLYNVYPDLTCLGKIIGGGLPVGAYGGKKQLMQLMAPEGPIYQAGTLSGNPLAMAAGLATLTQLGEARVYDTLERRSARLAEGFMANAHEFDIPLAINRVGSMLCPFFISHPVTNYDTALHTDTQKFANYFRLMRERGVYVPPSAFEGMFVSLAHEEHDIDFTIETHRQVLKKMKQCE